MMMMMMLCMLATGLLFDAGSKYFPMSITGAIILVVAIEYSRLCIYSFVVQYSLVVHFRWSVDGIFSSTNLLPMSVPPGILSVGLDMPVVGLLFYAGSKYLSMSIIGVLLFDAVVTISVVNGIFFLVPSVSGEALLSGVHGISSNLLCISLRLLANEIIFFVFIMLETFKPF